MECYVLLAEYSINGMYNRAVKNRFIGAAFSIKDAEKKANEYIDDALDTPNYVEYIKVSIIKCAPKNNDVEYTCVETIESKD